MLVEGFLVDLRGNVQERVEVGAGSVTQYEQLQVTFTGLFVCCEGEGGGSLVGSCEKVEYKR